MEAEGRGVSAGDRQHVFDDLQGVRGDRGADADRWPDHSASASRQGRGIVTYEQLMALKGNTPALCKDGKLGLVIRFLKDRAGIQVPGEEEIRWVPLERLQEAVGGIVETD